MAPPKPHPKRFHVAWMAVALATTAGCQCSQSAPLRVQVPVEGVEALTSGALLVNLLDTTVLSRISGAPGADVTFHQEYEFGPGMTLISLSQSVAANTDALLNAGAPGALPPLERDIALCSADASSGTRIAIPTTHRYQRPEIVIGGTPLGWLNHVKGRLTALRFAPDVPPLANTQLLVNGTVGVTSFSLGTTVEDVEVEFESAGTTYFVRLKSLSISCPGVIGQATSNVPAHYVACGEQNVRCVNPVVTLDGFESDYPLLSNPLVWLANGPVFHTLITDQLTAGINLHFQNFAASSLTFVGSSTAAALSLTGSSTVVNGTSVCSEVPPPEPPDAPTRALARLTGAWGRGEYVSDQGNVMPFDLIPEADVELTSSHPSTFKVMDRVELPDGVQWVRGVEAPRVGAPLPWPLQRQEFTPHGLATKLRTVRRVPRNCWVKPASIETLVEFTRERHYASRFFAKGKARFIGDLPDSLLRGKAQLQELREADFEREVRPAFEAAGLPCERCDSEQWSRLQFNVVGDPVPPGGFDPQTPPWEVIVWLDRDARELHEVFLPSLECGYAEGYQRVVSERRFSEPRVTVQTSMVDSVDLPSLNHPETDGRDSFARSTLRTPQGTDVFISLRERCPADEPGLPSVDSCWTETLSLPAMGLVTLESGVSGTVPARTSIRAATPSQIGSRTLAVQGLFDRSGIALYTPVPQVYRDIGLTTQARDYRGTRFLDWDHTPSGFSAPGGSSHIPAVKAAWNAQNRPYFADWRTDTVILEHRPGYPASFCSLPGALYAAPTGLRFEGGGFASPIDVAPISVMASPGAFGDYRVAPGVWGQARVDHLLP